MPTLFINTYRPMVGTPLGRGAVDELGIPPFADRSIRREPDLEHAFPSITCLCRGSNFAPRLRPGDFVVYTTKKGRFTSDARHWMMTAVLEVDRYFDNHRLAADWYTERGLDLPSNCMVKGNPPKSAAESGLATGCGPCGPKAPRGGYGQDRGHAPMEAGYRRRARKNGRFVVCRPHWVELGDGAVPVHDEDLIDVFGRLPGTRNPGALSITHLRPLLDRLGVPVPPSCP